MESIWKTEMPSFEKLEGDIKVDVLIIGGGMTGILCAHMLERAGVSCLVLEQNTICSGVTANTTAKITSQHGLVYHKLIKEFGAEQAGLYYRANQKALEEYRRLGSQIDCDFETRDSMLYTRENLCKLEQEMDALRRIGAQAQWKTQTDLPFPVEGCVCFPKQAQFHPLKLAGALAKKLNIREHSQVRAFDGSRFLTDRGSVTAEKTIVATHFPIFNKHGLYPLKLYQHRSYVLALENGGKVDGMYVDENKTGLSFRMAGNQLLIGGGAHRTGKTGGGWEELEAFSQKYYPGAQIFRRWATQDCMSLDGVPYIGKYSPKTPNLYVATGFNKWGMSSAMVAAQLLCDLVQEKQNPYGKVFAPSRRIMRSQMAVNGLHSLINLLTPTVPRCPHLGCALKWNAQEHSWDCPCHGSRFDSSGRVLDNPATDDLKPPQP